MTHVSLPLLLEDGSRLDWPDARYEPKVRVALDRARIRHSIAGAPSLERAVNEGLAKWAVEIRCPKTLLSRLTLAAEPQHTVTWRRDELDGVSWIIPGLLAVREFDLLAQELDPFWQDVALRVHPGWWLARGTKRKVNTLAQSLLRFVRDEKLDDGRMHVQPESGTGQLRFAAHIAPDIWPETQTSRTLQVAALIGACGHLPTIFGNGGEEEYDVAGEIRDLLEMAKVPVWTEEGYDPALAATVIERFYRTPESGGQEG